MQPGQGAIALGVLGREDVDDPVAHRLLLLAAHARQLAVQDLIGAVAFEGAAVVVARQRAPAAAEQSAPVAFDPVDRGVALVIGQGHGVPDRAFDRVLDILVGGADGGVARAQLQLGEDVAAEGGAAQGAQTGLLGVELGPCHRGGAGAGEGGVILAAPTPEARPAVAATGQEQNGDQKDHDRQGAAGQGRAMPLETEGVVRRFVVLLHQSLSPPVILCTP